MTAPQLQLVDAIIAAIQADVPGAAQWKTHRFEPIHHAGNGDHLAVWFDSESNRQANNTTSGSGHLDQLEAYGVRFWRQGPEGTRGTVDDGSGAAVLDIYNLVYTVLQKKQVYGGVTTQYYVRPTGGRIGIGGESESKIRLFEIVLEASRVRGFTG